ncbi:MAG: nucleoside 2-deoxyribosyltransferase [Opitutales bacterium]|nr:nucleoside 2-deoxyribosyltransferase [Opitutales bacterium]
MKNNCIYSIYFAGDLFDTKDLLGNAVLAEAINKVSRGKYKCVLPQDLLQDKMNPKGIRDSDILNLLSSDIAIFNFDGSELDSGTVVEFMFAKFADIPALQLRTDFRNGGDCISDNEHENDEVYPPWNLMASFYPRTEVLPINSAYEYSLVKGENSVIRMMQTIENIAKKIVKCLDKLIKHKPILKNNQKKEVCKWLLQMPNLDLQTKKKLKRAFVKKNNLP